MKFAFMTFSCRDSGFDEVLDIAKTYGYDGIELRTGGDHKHGVEPGADKAILQEAKRKAAEKGIAICAVATPCKLALSEDWQETMQIAKDSIKLAEEIGAPVIRVFGGKLDGEHQREETFERLVISLKELAKPAADAGITVCLETHDSWSCPKMVAKVMQAVNEPSVAVNWDALHTIARGNTKEAESFEILKPWIKHVHAHDGILGEGGRYTFKTFGEGVADYATVIRVLRDCDYTGYVSGEWINWEDSYEVHLPRELAKLKGFLEA